MANFNQLGMLMIPEPQPQPQTTAELLGAFRREMVAEGFEPHEVLELLGSITFLKCFEIRVKTDGP